MDPANGKADAAADDTRSGRNGQAERVPAARDELDRCVGRRHEIEKALHERISQTSESLEATTRTLLKSLEEEREAGYRLIREMRAREGVGKAADEGRDAALVAGVIRLQESLDESHARMGGLEARVAQLRRERDELERRFRSVHRERELFRQELDIVNSSFSMRIGAMLVASLRSPRELIRLPWRLVRLVGEALPRMRRAVSHRLGRPLPDDQSDLGPEIASGDASFADAAGLPGSGERLSAGPRLRAVLPSAPGDLRIAAVMDEFTQSAFASTCRLMPLTFEYWRDEIEEFRPHVLFVESAWRGRYSSWARRVYPMSTGLMELVEWCRARDIPTVFWNKEDPVHTSIFMKTARLFDFVFTTDIDCIRSYRSQLGHDQVYWMPFACEPGEHNPVELFQRRDAFCFAGSYYAKYGERRRDFAELAGAITALRPLEIYDRNHGTSDPGLQFPDEYLPLVRGRLPYREIAKAYKGYRFGVNMNTVKQSQSMFARRAFELLASNTVTVSNFSRGLRLMLGDLVPASDSGRQLVSLLAPVVADDSTFKRFRLAGLRKVMSEHTYADRLRYLLEKLRGEPIADDQPGIVVLALVGSSGAARAVHEQFTRQSFPRKRLVLVARSGYDMAGGAPDVPGVEFMTDADARALDLASVCHGEWLAVFQEGDHYGANYLTDLSLARRYSRAEVIGKSSHHLWTGEAPRLQDPGREYIHDQSFPARRALIGPARQADRSVAAVLSSDGACDDWTGFSIDAFNYCEAGADRDCRTVDDLEDVYQGMPIASMYALAESTHEEGDCDGDPLARLPGMEAGDLAGLLSTGNHGDGRVRLTLEGEFLLLESTLPADEHLYIYSDRKLRLPDVIADSKGRLNLVVDTEMLLSLVFLFFDAKGKRVGHAIRACSSNLNITPPKSAKTARVGIRVQGQGRAAIRKLVQGHVPASAMGVPASGEFLVVTKGYPTYENLYSYAYVHRRVKGYRQAGHAVDVFRVEENPLAFGEFEGVDVVSGQLADLELMLRTNRYRGVLVHSLDRSIWSVLRSLPTEVPIHVWVHGAEIQPWYRRDFSFLNEHDRQRGKERSADRMAFWRELVDELPSNLTLVFVSMQLARTAMRDLGRNLPAASCRIIHNHIDASLFAYAEKDPAQRLKVLSIRPYNRPTYPNELTVKAILDLSLEPWFDEVEFRLVGDGALFDATVAPLRGMQNVVLDKRFLSQVEIAQLHREYGVFLCPTRIDSQGVSRDEAMSSGLVPVTNRVSAVPEFVDESCGVLVEPEDWKGLADAIRTLRGDPGLFSRLSRAASVRVRNQSGKEQTLGRELELFATGEPGRAPAPERARLRIALYGDLDLNVIDGSAVWAASLARLLSHVDGVEVDLFLKTPIRSTTVLASVIREERVRLVEPDGIARLSPAQAVEAVLREDAHRNYAACILRGYELARVASDDSGLDGRRVVYLTDVPHDLDGIDDGERERMARVLDAASLLLCQTPQLQAHLEKLSPVVSSKSRLLPPMLPLEAVRAAQGWSGVGPFRIAYAGKFAPEWGVLEMFDCLDELRSQGLDVELHVFGDKVHAPASQPGFAKRVEQRLAAGEGLHWHRGRDRNEVLHGLSGMHLGWAWRSPVLESSTHELSTKVLEYASIGLPVILAPGPINEALLGPDYPLFAVEPGELQERIRGMLDPSACLEDLGPRLQEVAERYSPTRITRDHLVPFVDAVGAWRDGAGDRAGSEGP